MVLLERWEPGGRLCAVFRRMVVLLAGGLRGTRFRRRSVCFRARRNRGIYCLLVLLRAGPRVWRALGLFRRRAVSRQERFRSPFVPQLGSLWGRRFRVSLPDRLRARFR